MTVHPTLPGLRSPLPLAASRPASADLIVARSSGRRFPGAARAWVLALLAATSTVCGADRGPEVQGGGAVAGNPLPQNQATCPFVERKLDRTVVTPWVATKTEARGGGLRTGGTYAVARVTWTCTIYNVFKVFKCTKPVVGHGAGHHGIQTEEWVAVKTVTVVKEYGVRERILPPAPIGGRVESPPKK